MLPVIARRIVISIPLLLFVSFAAFALFLLLPGDGAQAIAGEEAAPEQVERVREILGLDRPFFTRYGDWLWSALHGDLGTSMVTHTDLSGEILRRAPITVSLAGAAVLLTVVGGFPIGLIQAMRSGGRLDNLLRTVTSVFLSLPDYWLGTILVSLFAVRLAWFPAYGFVSFAESPVQWVLHLILPALALSLSPMAEVSRHVRAGLLRVQNEKYIRTALAKGMTARVVIGKHALKNAMIPVVTILGMRAISLLGGVVIIELIFGLPGIGQMTLRAVLRQDVTSLQALVLVAGTIVVVMNLIVDIVYATLNPRVRVGS